MKLHRALTGKRPRVFGSASRTLLLPVLFTALVLFFPQGLLASVEQITILHVNDTHGHIVPYMDKTVSESFEIGGADRLATMIEEERAKNPDGTILLSGGDMFQGTPVSNVFRGKPVIDLMNYLGFDAMAIGNHEFDWGQPVLRENIGLMRFPVLSANILAGDRTYFDGAKPYTAVVRRGIKIGIIGLTTPELAYTTKPSNVAGLTVSDPASILPGAVSLLRAEGADVVVVLSHIGLDADRDLARKVSGVDVIVGGHSHTAVPDPVAEAGAIIVQAGCCGAYLGVLQLQFDTDSRKITDHTKKDALRLVFSRAGNPTDPGAAAIVEKYEKQVEGEFSKPAGVTKTDLVRNPRGESNVGDLIADALRKASGAQVAFFNGGGIRADLPAGPVTNGQVYTVLPFDNTLVTMDLSGGQIRQILEQSIACEKILQVSGLKVAYDLKQPEGSKVAAVFVAGKPLRPQGVYRVATNDFLAAGGDMFKTFQEGENIVYGDPVRDIVAKYLRKRSPVCPRTEGRISFK
jgi:5'-nucleotidase / UDP-sugar diphosphatase